MAPKRYKKKSSPSAGTMHKHLIKVPVPANFDLGLAVSSYGFFMLAPNRWVKAEGDRKAAFERPLRKLDDSPVPVRITQESGSCSAGSPGTELHVAVTAEAGCLSPEDQQHISGQVVRMLRLTDADVAVVRALQDMHTGAKADNYGHMFRSPTLWEDMVKSITLCNCGWGRTINMNAALCSEVGSGGAFPTPAEIVGCGADALRDRCSVGYRAKTICGLAQQFMDGEVASLEVEGVNLDAAQLYKRVLPLSGMGPFTAANVLQLLGHYEEIPADTETMRHLKKHHKPPNLTSKDLKEVAQKVYDRFAPYQFLVYWYELRKDYENLFGPLTHMDPEDYARATGHIMRAGATASLAAAPRVAQPLITGTASADATAAAVEAVGQLLGSITSAQGPTANAGEPSSETGLNGRKQRRTTESMSGGVGAVPEQHVMRKRRAAASSGSGMAKSGFQQPRVAAAAQSNDERAPKSARGKRQRGGEAAMPGKAAAESTAGSGPSCDAPEHTMKSLQMSATMPSKQVGRCCSTVAGSIDNKGPQTPELAVLRTRSRSRTTENLEMSV